MQRILSTLPLIAILVLFAGCGGGGTSITSPGINDPRSSADQGVGGVNGQTGGADDPAGHDANDDNGAGDDDGPNHDLNDDNGGGNDDGPNHQ